MYKLPLLQIVRRPGIIELGWGHPDSALAPVEAVKSAAARTLERFGADALQYGYAAGPGPLLEWLIARIAAREGRAPGADEILITAGNSQGLDQILTLGTSPGDTVLVESPTYHLAVRIMREHPLHLAPVPADAQGLNVDAMSETIARLKQEGQKPRALYLVPTFNNPTGVSLSEARRRSLVELAAEEHLLIIEDDVYRELAYDSPAPPSLWSIAPPGVVARLGSFSKSLAPGLRVGWLTAGRDLVTRFAEGALLDSGGGINHFAALVVACLCEAGDYDRNVERLRSVYRERRDALLRALARYVPQGQVTVPHGGFFIWVTLREEFDTRELLTRAEQQGVAFLPGPVFYFAGGDRNALRLAFTLYPPEELEEGARRLGQALA